MKQIKMSMLASLLLRKIHDKISISWHTVSQQSEDRMRISNLYENTVRFSTTYFLFSTTKSSYELTKVPRSLMLLPLIHHKVLDEALDLAYDIECSDC